MSDAIPRQACELLCSDLRVALAVDDKRALRARVTLFELMYLSEPEESRVASPNSQRLALKMDTGEVIICDEYDPADNGRVHIIPAHRYAHFHVDTMVLEYSKMALDVDKILYQGHQWPDDVPGYAPAQLVGYFLDKETP